MREQIDAFDRVAIGCSHRNEWLSGAGLVAPPEEGDTVLVAGPFSYDHTILYKPDFLYRCERVSDQLNLPSHVDALKKDKVWETLFEVVRDEEKKQVSIHLRLKPFREALQREDQLAKEFVYCMLMLQEVAHATFPANHRFRCADAPFVDCFRCDTTDVDVDMLGVPAACRGGGGGGESLQPFPHQLSMAALAVRLFDGAPLRIRDRFAPEWAHGIDFSELDSSRGSKCGGVVGENFLLPGLLDTSDVGNGKTGSVILFVATMAERSIDERLAFFSRAQGNFRDYSPQRLLEESHSAEHRAHKPVVPVLIVVPVHLVRQWSDEFVRWAPSLAVLAVCERKDLHRVTEEQMRVLDAMVVAVNQVDNLVSFYPHFVFSVLVVDEACETLKCRRKRPFPAHYGRWLLNAADEFTVEQMWHKLVFDTKQSGAIESLAVHAMKFYSDHNKLLHGLFHSIVPVRHNANPHMRTEVRHHVHASPLLPEERLLISERAMGTVRGVAFPKTANDGDGDAGNNTNVTLMTHRQLLERMVDSRREHLERLEKQMEDANKSVRDLDAFFASEAAAALPDAQRRVLVVQQQQLSKQIANTKTAAESVRAQLVFREASVAALRGEESGGGAEGGGEESGSAAECPICMGSNEEEPLAMLPGCAHVFGAACLAEWAQKNRSCPQCRHKPATWEVFALERRRSRKGAAGVESAEEEERRRRKELQQLHGSKVAEVLMHILSRPDTHRFLVGAKYDETAEQLCHALELSGVKTVRVVGDALSQRRAMGKFTHKDSTDRVLVVSSTAAASGSNLQSCVDEVLMTHVPCGFDSRNGGEVPDMRFVRQTIGRAARGLRKELDVHWFVTANTVEETMYRENVAPEL
jgi:hypothetical protein